jgi:hypothetical protein
MSMEENQQVIFTPEKRDRLRTAYNKAVATHQDTFMFDGVELVTDYAKYLLEYLDTVFK